MKSPIKIPKQCYVGVVNDNNSKSMPTARISPYGKDPGSKGRIDTINSWLKYYSGRGMKASIVIDNEQLSGFRISDSIGSDAWLIEDPRGFEVEISATTLLNLLETTTVQNGEILEPCVWARQGPSNVLLSIQSQEYKVAVSNTVVSEQKANWRDVKLGNRITLQNSVCGTYLGKMWIISYNSYANVTIGYTNDIKCSAKEYYVILECNKKTPDKLRLLAAPKLSSFDDYQEMSASECEELANEKLRDPNCEFICNGQYESGVVVLVNEKPNLNTDIKINEIHIQYRSANELKKDMDRQREAIFVISENKFGKIRKYMTFMIIEHNYENFKNGIISRVCNATKVPEWLFDPTATFMNVEVEVSSKSGNNFKYVLR